MGSFKYSQPTKRKRKLGKVEALLHEKLQKVEWGEFSLGELFVFEAIKQARSQREIPTDNSKKGIPYIVQSMFNNMVSRTVNKDWLIKNNEAPVSGNRIVLGVTLPAISYQPKEFGASQVITAKADWLNEKNGVYISATIGKLMSQFSYSKKPGLQIYKDMVISLPTKKGKIDLEFIESFIAELEAQRIAELEAFLLASGLKDYYLTKEEQKVLEDFENIEWKTFNLQSLFGKSTRGQRLKSTDRILGNLPFVTAGEFNDGISAFIGNDVHIFSENTTTIDMFGSAKYRNYKYGGDDHVAIVHTENLPKLASIFVTSSIHKTSSAGQFSYSRNFYAKDADELNISLPVINNKPNYKLMEIFITAIQKLVIKEVVLYADRKIEATKNVVSK